MRSHGYDGPERRRVDVFDRWLARISGILMLVLFSWAVWASVSSNTAERRVTNEIRRNALQAQKLQRIHVCYTFLNQYAIERDVFAIANTAKVGEGVKPTLVVHETTVKACEEEDIDLPKGLTVVPDRIGAIHHGS